MLLSSEKGKRTRYDTYHPTNGKFLSPLKVSVLLETSAALFVSPVLGIYSARILDPSRTWVRIAI